METEKPVIAFLNKIADLLLLNFIFIICCIPIITIGPALTALYHVSLRSVRYGDGYVVREFFRSFRQNFVQSLIAWIVTVVIGGMFIADIIFWSRSGSGMISSIMIIVSACFVFQIFITVLWLFPMIAKMENKFWVNVKNAAAMAVGHFFPQTIICAGITIAAGYMSYTSLIMDVLMLLIGFSLLAYIKSFFYYKVFAKYIEEEPMGEDDLLYSKKGAEMKQKREK